MFYGEHWSGRERFLAVIFEVSYFDWIGEGVIISSRQQPATAKTIFKQYHLEY
jgi:hypothetical protein